VRVLNDITATKADFVIDEQDFHATQREAASQALLEVLGKLGNLEPNMALRIMRMAIDVSSWPNKDEMVQALDQITGYKDPAEALTPQEKQAQQQAEQQAKAQQEKQQAQADAQIQAQIDKDKAAAQKALADAQKSLAEAEAKRREAGGDGGAAQKAYEQAKRELEAAQRQIADLEHQARMREVQQAANTQVDRYKIETDAATKLKVAQMNNATEGAARASEAQANAPAPEHSEAIADVSQDLKALARDVKKLAEGQMKADAETKGRGAVSPISLDIGKVAGEGLGEVTKSLTAAIKGIEKMNQGSAKGMESAVAAITKAAETLAAAAKNAEAREDAGAKKRDEDDGSREAEFELGDGRKVKAKWGRSKKKDQPKDKEK
jgi:hypothetical protein